MVNQFREQYIQLLHPFFLQTANYFFPTAQIELRFNPGWDTAQSLEQAISADFEKDMRYGYTQSGPHRADFLTYHEKRSVKDYLSGGEQKLLMLALMLSQVSLLKNVSHTNCCILIDDMAAELDTVNRSKLLKYLAETNSQVFITSTELDGFDNLDELNNYKVFHVEQGCVQQLKSFT